MRKNIIIQILIVIGLNQVLLAQNTSVDCNCARTQSQTLVFEDSLNNIIDLTHIASLPKKLDTLVLKNSFRGKIFTDGTQHMCVTIYEITEQKKGIYDVRLTILPKCATTQDIIEQFGFKHYVLKYKRNVIQAFNYSHSEI